MNCSFRNCSVVCAESRTAFVLLVCFWPEINNTPPCLLQLAEIGTGLAVRQEERSNLENDAKELREARRNAEAQLAAAVENARVRDGRRPPSAGRFLQGSARADGACT